MSSTGTWPKVSRLQNALVIEPQPDGLLFCVYVVRGGEEGGRLWTRDPLTDPIVLDWMSRMVRAFRSEAGGEPGAVRRGKPAPPVPELTAAEIREEKSIQRGEALMQDPYIEDE